MRDRIGCCIPACRRTFPRKATDDDDYEVICRRHWRMIDAPLRARQKLMHKRWRKINRLLQLKAIQGRRRGLDRLTALFSRAQTRSWLACKEDAVIKAAFGIEDAPRRRPVLEAMS